MSRQYSNVISIDDEVHYFCPKIVGGKSKRIVMNDHEKKFFWDPINFNILYFCNTEKDGA